MSANKLKYYEVVTSTIVSANNMSDAEALASGKRGVEGSILDSETEVFRTDATTAKSFTA